MNQQTISKKTIRRIIFTFFTLSLIPLIAYWSKFFGGFFLSNKIEDWASFSTFYFGYLSMIGTLLNSVAFIWLSLYIHNNESSRQAKEVNLQKLIATTELRKSVLETFQKNVDIITKQYKNIELIELSQLNVFLIDFKKFNRNLFVMNDMLFDKLIQSVKSLISCKESGGEQTSILNAINEYLESKNRLSEDLYDQLINSLNKE